MFYAYNKDRSYIKFEYRNGELYYLDVDNRSGHTNLLTTVKGQKEIFSDLDMKKAMLGRYIQKYLCLSSNKDFSNNLETDEIKECGVDCGHINIASKIYGPIKHDVEGKSVKETT